MLAEPSCSVILIHGLGDQSSDWSQDFRTALKNELGSSATEVDLLDAYWAPLSTVEDSLHPRLSVTRPGLEDVTLGDETYRRTVLEFSRMLAAEAGASAGAHTFGPSDTFDLVKGLLPGGLELVVDVGNYVAHNSVRTAVQNILHTKLGEARAEDPDASVLLVSHSQGTVISFDVLRQAGANYPGLRTWMTMGSPLRKYFAFPLFWGRLQLGVPPDLRWVNLFDQLDIVGKGLAGAVDWVTPQPEDRMVDNEHNASGPHDHWNNPEVVQAVSAEIVRLLG